MKIRKSFVRNFLSIMIIMTITATQSMAQDYKLPKFTKILEVVSKGVNVRQQPSVNSPKLDCGSPDFLMVIDETADWYHAAILTNGEGDGEVVSQPGYVSKKVCKVRELKTLDENYARSVLQEADFTYNIRQAGKYKGYSIITYRSNYAADDHSGMFIGKMYGNCCIGAHVGFEYEYDSNQIKITLGWDNDDLVYLYIPDKQVYNQEKGEYDFNGLTDQNIDRIFSISGKEFTNILLPGTVRYHYRDGNGATGNGVSCYFFNHSLYQGEITWKDSCFINDAASIKKASMPDYPEFKHEKFAIKAPSLDKIVCVTADGVNIRKQPNAQSPRLIAVPNEDYLDCPAELIWINRTPKKNEEVVYANEFYIFPLLGESGDWYKVYLDRVRGNTVDTEAYIMKKFCKVEKITPLTLPAPEGWNVAMVKSGKYAGLCLMYEFNGMDDEPKLKLGKYSDGMFLFTHTIMVQMSDENKIKFVDGEFPYLSVGKNMFNISDISGEPDLDLNKFISNERLLDVLINNIDKMNKYFTTIYYGVEGVDYWQSFETEKLE